jgi:hypothetical protein
MRSRSLRRISNVPEIRRLVPRAASKEAAWLSLCVVVTIVPFASCAESPRTAMEQAPMNSAREFRVKGETIRIDEGELEAIRKAVVDLLSTKDDDVHRALREDLQKSIAVVGPEDSRLGPWALTDREDSLALVRIPPRGAINYSFVAKLSREGGRWHVTDFYQERMYAR